MSTYRKIHGRSIQAVTTDPTETVAEGQVWYNTTSDTFKSIVASEAWSSASPLITGRYMVGGFGTPTAGVATAGQTPSPSTNISNTEHYNGVGWSSETAYPTTGYNIGGAGTQTAGLAAGGIAPSRTTTSNTYNGTSWTSTGSLPVAADNLSFCGNTRTGAIGAVGRTPSTGNSGTNTSVVYDGSSFSSGPNLNTTRMYGNAAGSGTGTAGLIWGGFIDPSPNSMTNTEEYDGSSWTNGGPLNTASSFPSGFGTQTDTVCQVNSPNYQGSERYDGTSWTALPNIGIASPGGLYGNKAFSPTGTSSGYIVSMSPTSTSTAEWNVTVNTVTAAAWASGGAAPVGNSNMNMSGYKDDAMMWGGDTGGPPSAWPTTSHSYNGSSWTADGTIPSVRVVAKQFGAGHTDATSMGGYPGINAATIQYNGSAWTAGGSANHGNEYGYNTGAGPQTAGAILGGGGTSAKHENYDGTSWTERTDFPSGANFVGTIGTQTALLGVSGANGTTATWNGSAWTAVSNTLNTPREYGAAGGANSSEAYMFGGGPPTVRTQTELYNGTSWASQPNMANGRNSAGGSGISNSGLIAGAFYPGNTAVEEFTAETTSLNVKTLTQS